MALSIDSDGTITMYQGDTGEIIINGLNTDKNYKVYLCIRDENDNVMGDELVEISNLKDKVKFFLSSKFTDLLTVPKGETNKTYYYAVKLCELGTQNEDTLFIAGKGYGEKNLLIIYPKQVEGTINE